MSSDRLPVERGFRMWAPSYEVENPVTDLDRQATRRLAPAPPGGTLLDVGCGTGRRLPQPGGPDGPIRVVGLDLVPAMLVRGRSRFQAGIQLAAGRIETIPLRPGLFDVVWCRLVIGFVQDIERAFISMGSQLRPPGLLLVTDLHPDLVAEGAERGFHAKDGTWQVIEAHSHPADRLVEAAARAGLDLVDRVDLPIGREQADAYRAVGRDDLYREHRQRPVLLGLTFRSKGLTPES